MEIGDESKSKLLSLLALCKDFDQEIQSVHLLMNYEELVISGSYLSDLEVPLCRIIKELESKFK